MNTNTMELNQGVNAVMEVNEPSYIDNLQRLI